MDEEKESSTTGQFLKNTFDLRAWIDFDRIVSGKNFIATTVRRLFIPTPSKAKESFETAQKRLGLQDSDLALRAQSLLRLSLFTSVLGVSLLLYSIYLLCLHSPQASIFTLVVAGLFFAMAFRYHFWYYQIQQKKLGLSIKEWLYNGLMGKKNV